MAMSKVMCVCVRVFCITRTTQWGPSPSCCCCCWLCSMSMLHPKVLRPVSRPSGPWRLSYWRQGSLAVKASNNWNGHVTMNCKLITSVCHIIDMIYQIMWVLYFALIMQKQGPVNKCKKFTHVFYLQWIYWGGWGREVLAVCWHCEGAYCI